MQPVFRRRPFAGAASRRRSGERDGDIPIHLLLPTPACRVVSSGRVNVLTRSNEIPNLDVNGPCFRRQSGPSRISAHGLVRQKLKLNTKKLKTSHQHNATILLTLFGNDGITTTPAGTDRPMRRVSNMGHHERRQGYDFLLMQQGISF